MTDSLYLKWRRVRWTLLNLVLLAAIAGLAMCTLGCFEPIPSVAHVETKPPIDPSPAAKPGPVEAKDQELAAAVATVARLTHERDELRLAPLRASLLWAEGISLLGMLAGFGLAAAALFWGLGFTWKIPGGIAVCFGAVLVTALAAGAALNHIGLIIGAVAVLAIAGIVYLIHRQVSVSSAGLKAWNAVPDHVDLGAQAEALLGSLERKTKA